MIFLRFGVAEWHHLMIMSTSLTWTLAGEMDLRSVPWSIISGLIMKYTRTPIGSKKYFAGLSWLTMILWRRKTSFTTMILPTKLQKRSLVFQVCWTPRTCWTRTHRTSSASSPMSPSSTTCSRMRIIQDHHLFLSRRSLWTRKILSTQLNHLLKVCIFE